MLKLYFGEYESENWKCNECHGVNIDNVRCGINKWPRTLIVHLNRFQIVQNLIKKNNNKIEFQSKIENLNRFARQEIGKSPNCYYKLNSVIMHLGSGTKQGHYINYRRNKATKK